MFEKDMGNKGIEKIWTVYLVFICCLIMGGVFYPDFEERIGTQTDARHPLFRAGWTQNTGRFFNGYRSAINARKKIGSWADSAFPGTWMVKQEIWQDQTQRADGRIYRYSCYRGWWQILRSFPDTVPSPEKMLEECGARILGGIYDPGRKLMAVSWGMAWMQDGVKTEIQLGEIFLQLPRDIRDGEVHAFMARLTPESPLPVYRTKPLPGPKKLPVQKKVRRPVETAGKPAIPPSSKPVSKIIPKYKTPLTIEKPKKYKIAIVIDDFGHDLELGKRFLDLDIPFTAAILPGLKHSVELAEYAHRKGKEIILHLPMEAIDSTNDPGPGAIRSSMTESEIREEVRKNLNAVPFVSGVNNHMGSKITSNPGLMKIILEEINKNRDFYLDSYTVNTSVGFKLAKEMRMPAAKRDIFLDDDPDAVYKQLEKTVAWAKKNGFAISIGHVREKTYQVLKDFLGALPENETEFVFISDVL